MAETAQRQRRKHPVGCQHSSSPRGRPSSRFTTAVACCIAVAASRRIWTLPNTSHGSSRDPFPSLWVSASLLQLNIKSKALSRLLQRRNGTSTTFAGMTSQLPDLALDDVLHVDVSGDLQVHVFGPFSEPAAWNGPSTTSGRVDFAGVDTSSRQGTTVALFRGRPSSPSPWWWVLPNWFVGLHYDFAASWYGATRVWSNCQWTVPTLFPHQNPWLRRLVPRSLDVTVDRSVVDSTDRVGQAVLRWPVHAEEGSDYDSSGNDDNECTSLAARIESSGSSSLSLQVPLHRRLLYHCTLESDWLEESSSPAAGLGGFPLAKTTVLDGEAWWLPDVTLKANGRLESRNAAVFPHPQRPLDGRIGVRLMASRRLLWDDSPGFFATTEPSTTSLCVEVQDLQELAITGVRLHAELERPLESWRLAVVQQLYLPSVPRWRARRTVGESVDASATDESPSSLE